MTEAPECDRVYNRTIELTTLKQWILQEKIRIVTISQSNLAGESISTSRASPAPPALSA
ncbi:MAG: hypothetical protein RIE73_26365 [Coleofasciculus sp. C1-SOL-03]|uniref:hypothetical protein n=1 Tax=Coleofasciculus sp. C1-SOL-03 TaxID=3069522 RepID=UPI0032F164EA